MVLFSYISIFCYDGWPYCCNIDLNCALKTKGLMEITDEELFSIGAVIWIISAILNLIWFFVVSLFFVSISGPPHASVIIKTLDLSFSANQYMMYSFLFLGFFIIGGLFTIISFVARIILAIAFWRFGGNNKSDLIQVGR